MKTGTLIKGIGLGLVTGALVTAAVLPMDKKRGSRASRALKALTNIMEGVTEAIS